MARNPIDHRRAKLSAEQARRKEARAKKPSPSLGLAMAEQELVEQPLPSVEEAEVIARAQLEAGQIVQPVLTPGGLYVYPS